MFKPGRFGQAFFFGVLTVEPCMGPGLDETGQWASHPIGEVPLVQAELGRVLIFPLNLG